MKRKEHDKKHTEVLAEIVSHVFEANVFERRRLRPNVNARMVFSKILLDKGITLSEIGRILDKNHATIFHYNNKLSFFLEHDFALRQKYLRCVDEYESQSVHSVTKTKLLDELYKLRKELNEVKDLYQMVTLKNKESSRYDERLRGIYNVVRDRTSIGREEEMELRIKRLYNTVV